MMKDNVTITQFQEMLRSDEDNTGLVEALRRLMGLTDATDYLASPNLGWVAW